jgi:hypothetical protein
MKVKYYNIDIHHMKVTYLGMFENWDAVENHVEEHKLHFDFEWYCGIEELTTLSESLKSAMGDK